MPFVDDFVALILDGLCFLSFDFFLMSDRVAAKSRSATMRYEFVLKSFSQFKKYEQF